MKRVLRAAALLALVTVPVATLAGAGHTDRLARHLGLAPEIATEVAGLLEEARMDGEALKEQVQAEAQALRDARDGGDDKAIRRAVKNLRDLRDEAHAIRADAEDRILDHLTPSQQADFALMQLERRAKLEQARTSRRGDSEIPTFE